MLQTADNQSKCRCGDYFSRAISPMMEMIEDVLSHIISNIGLFVVDVKPTVFPIGDMILGRIIAALFVCYSICLPICQYWQQQQQPITVITDINQQLGGIYKLFVVI